MEKFLRSCWALAAALLVTVAVSTSGCKKSDVALVTSSPYGRNEGTIGMTFEHYDLFLSKSWTAAVDSKGSHSVIFIARLPVDRVLKVATRDSGNWLTFEKNYSRDVLPHVRAAYLKITFLITSRDSFGLSSIRLGISSGTKTAWSSDFREDEKQQIMASIYLNSPTMLPILARYADPSFREGSTLYAKLTGKNIRDFLPAQ
jgi:hypothetical protein